MPNVIKITLQKIKNTNKATISITGAEGQSESGQFDLPWVDNLAWNAVYTCLELHEEDPDSWQLNEEVMSKAQELGLFLKGGHPSNDRFQIIGQELYNLVIGTNKKVEQLLHSLLTEEHTIVEFHIPDEGSILQSYPWELLHNERGFLFDGTHASIVRHVDYQKSVSKFDSTLLNVLYVAPRPDPKSFEYSHLGHYEKLRLEYLNRLYDGSFKLDVLRTNTIDELHKYLLTRHDAISVIHIDTHGGYGWVCRCGYLNSPSDKYCENCNKERTVDQREQGYLVFENEEYGYEWVSGLDIGKSLVNRRAQLVVLTACKSGMVGGNSSFNSVAGALIKNDIPAVVANQFSIEVKQAEKLVEFLYLALLQRRVLTQAVNEVRKSLHDSWYRPVLYTRTNFSESQTQFLADLSQLKEVRDLRPRERWVAIIGFERDPFESIDGSIDPNLKHYFYFRMRHFDEIYDVERAKINIILGPPGSGKSSIRNVLSQLYRQRENILPVEYKNFGAISVSNTDSKIDLDNHLIQIIRATLKTLANEIRNMELEVSKLGEEHKTIYSDFLWNCVQKYESDSVNRFIFQTFLYPGDRKAADMQSNTALPEDMFELLGTFFRYVSEFFGFSSSCVFVDPNEILSFDQIESLIETSRWMNLVDDKVAVKFFLSDQFRDRVLDIPWVRNGRDKFVYNLEWPENELRSLLRERLIQSSASHNYESLGQISDIDHLDDLVISFAKGSPRALIVICNRLFSEHSRNWSLNDEDNLFIKESEIQTVLKLFEPKPLDTKIGNMIAGGESDNVEFKSTMRWNIFKKQKDKEMEHEIARTICGFLNTNGGTLLIGVTDDGKILGLENDFSTLGGRQSKDGFEQAFVNITTDMFSSPLSPDYFKAYFEEIQDKLIYVVEVQKNEEAVFCKFSNESEFYVRKQTATTKLDVEDTTKYITGHFR